MRFVLALLAALQDPHFDRGRELYAQGLYEEAIDELEKADANAPAVVFELAVTYEKVDRCQAAVDAWEKLLRLDPGTSHHDEIAQHLREQRWRLGHNECKDAPKRAPFTAGESPRRGRERYRAREPETPLEHYGWALGFRLGLVLGRIGSSDELSGTPGYTPIEEPEGFNARVALQIPLIRREDHAPILQLEPFFALSYYGFNTPIILVDTGGAQLTTVRGGSAMMTLFGAAVRGSIPLSPKVSLTPGLGLGLGFQSISMDTICQVSASLASPVMTFDLPFRIDTEPHHAIYLTPASLYVIFPPGGSGDSFDSSCLGMPGGTFDSKSLFGLDSTKLNYAFDVGYMYQF
jgi:hypothetical protein